MNCLNVLPSSSPLIIALQIWDYNILNTRITNDFAGDQDAFVEYLVQQIQGPWSSKAASAYLCTSIYATVSLSVLYTSLGILRRTWE